jgi:hypothetical protein
MPESESITCTTCGKTVKPTHMEVHKTTLFHIRKGKQTCDQKRATRRAKHQIKIHSMPNDAKYVLKLKRQQAQAKYYSKLKKSPKLPPEHRFSIVRKEEIVTFD